MGHSHEHDSSKETLWTAIVIMVFVATIAAIVETHRTEIESSEHSGHVH